MRRIKFRAKTVKIEGFPEKWVYGHLFKTPLTSENFEADSFSSGVNRWCISTVHGVVYEIDPKTIGEFTGLFDSNNNEIYEGDLLVRKSFKEKERAIFEVYFSNGFFLLKRHVPSETTLGYGITPELLEKIGNTLEHPIIF